MQTSDKIQEGGNSLIQKIFKNIKPLYALYAALPLLLIYPKPLMYILKPIIRNWSFHYKKINSVTNRPIEIILASNSKISFSKKQIMKLNFIRGTVPQAFRLIRESIFDEDQIKQNQDQSMKHILINKKNQFQKDRIFGSCYLIDMQDTYTVRIYNTNVSNSQLLNERKKSHNNSAQDNSSNAPKQMDSIWVEIILMKLKILQLQNNSESIKHVIIKANQRVLQLLQAKILGIEENEAFKLGIVGQNKIHILKLNKTLETYEHCSATFKIQQKPLNNFQ